MEDVIHIDAGAHQVVITNEIVRPLAEVFAHEHIGRAFVLMDENTHLHCFDRLSAIQGLQFHPLVIGAGEEHKTMQTVSRVCEMLMKKNAHRHDVLINLGGGVVCDIGGFVASIYQRGIRFINIPTSLLAMTDAAIGGKTGVDLAGYKNMVGTFSNPIKVIIDLKFLQSLPKQEWRNGMTESIKHALIGDGELWNIIQKNFDTISFENRCTRPMSDFVARSVKVKADIVKQDPMEQNLRRFLNFGHTVGHAIETWSLLHGERSISHGEAVAIGLVCESYISQKLRGLDPEIVVQVKSIVKSLFPHSKIEPGSEAFLIAAMGKDKKAAGSTIPCVVIEAIGSPCFLQEVDVELIQESFQYFNRF